MGIFFHPDNSFFLLMIFTFSIIVGLHPDNYHSGPQGHLCETPGSPLVGGMPLFWFQLYFAGISALVVLTLL